MGSGQTSSELTGGDAQYNRHQLSDIQGRLAFGSYLSARGLVGRAVEVGTHRGDFAVPFLLSWAGESLVCIDPWHTTPDSYARQAELLRTYLNGADSRLDDMVYCQRFLEANAPGRYELLVASSPAAADLFLDGSLDFVYIDGDHERAAVEADIRAWWPKLRAGGVLAGHDFICNEPDGGWGANIYPAVVEFAAQCGVTAYEVREPDGMPSSFMLIRPG